MQQQTAQVATTLGAVAVAVTQLLIYNLADDGEHYAHFLEFSFEIFSSLVTFCFCMKWSLDQSAAERSGGVYSKLGKSESAAAVEGAVGQIA